MHSINLELISLSLLPVLLLPHPQPHPAPVYCHSIFLRSLSLSFSLRLFICPSHIYVALVLANMMRDLLGYNRLPRIISRYSILLFKQFPRTVHMGASLLMIPWDLFVQTSLVIDPILG